MTDTDTESPDTEPRHEFDLPVSTLTPNDVMEYLSVAVSNYGSGYCDPESQYGGNCRNVYRGDDGEVTARCIAAEVLHLWGVPDAALERRNGEPVGFVINEFNLPVSPGARVILGAAQTAQDNGDNWLKAKMVASRVRDELRQTGLIDK